MITVLMGPQATTAAHHWALSAEPPLWFSYDDTHAHPGTIRMRGPHYPALAAYAQRRCHPKAGLTEMHVADITAMRSGRATVRHPAATDFMHDADLLRITKLFSNELGRYDRLVFSSFSAFYDEVMAEVGTGIQTPRQAKVLEFGAALAADALTRLVWDLDSGGHDLVLVTWDVRPGKAPLPHMPTATLRLADTVAWAEEELTIITSGSPDLIPGNQYPYEILATTERAHV